jgi:hypothetical protein
MLLEMRVDRRMIGGSVSSEVKNWFALAGGISHLLKYLSLYGATVFVRYFFKEGA